MRKVLLFAGAAAAAGQAASEPDTGICVLNGARAVDDLLDSATFIWASVERCKKPGKKSSGNQILCAMDVASVIESMNSMINVVLKGVEACGHLSGAEAKCGLAAGVVTRTMAGVAAASAGVAAKCPNPLNNGKALTSLTDGPNINQGNSGLASAAQQASFAQCLVDVGDVTKTLFKATNRIILMRHGCEGEDAIDCSHNSLKLAASFAALGEYLAGAAGRCSANTAKNAGLQGDAECGEQALDLVRHLTRMSSAGITMSEDCKFGEQRLYELENGAGDEEHGSNSLTLLLGAFLPITAVVGFLAGSRVARSRVIASAQDTELE